HPIHPKAHASLSLPQWTHMFEQENGGVPHNPLEVRYPFLDLRMVNYLLALPPFPWFFEKLLLREAMAGRLPESVRTRPKTPFEANPVAEQIRRTGTEQFKKTLWDPEAERYIDRSALVVPHDKMNSDETTTNLRPYSLNVWLRSARRVHYRMHAEAGNG